ncbi:MAG: Rqc2 family fibronectin-binding protein [Anaerolineae bacterium]
MYYDTLATTAMVDELQQALSGGRVQDVVLVDALTLGLEVYAQKRRHYVVLSAQPGQARVHCVSEKLRRGPESPLPILLLARKHVRNARVQAISQPGSERIIRFDLDGPEGALSLIAEIMGRRSNLLLVDAAGTVMEAIKRVTPEQSRRPVQPRQPYFAPPPLDKPSVAVLTPSRLRALLAEGDGPLWRRLTEQIAGMSPLLGREIAFRTAGDAEAAEAEATTLLEVARMMLVDLPASRAWEPCLGLIEGHAVAYAPYMLLHLGERRRMPTFSAAIEAFVQAGAAGSPYAEAKARVAKLLAAAREREERRRAAIERDLLPPEEIDRLREAGQWILAYATQIAPRQNELVVEGPGGEPWRIPLDAARSPVDNAQRYFKRYEDAKRALLGAPERLAQVQRALDRLAQWATDLELAENRGEIEEVRSLLAQAGYLRSASVARAQAMGPKRIETEEGLVLLVGRNSRQNQAVLERAAPGDLWLHARGVPGGHLILMTGGRMVPEPLLLRAAALAAYYSAARQETRVLVDVTERRHVRPIAGAGPGQVTYRQERTVEVAPSPWRDCPPA